MYVPYFLLFRLCSAMVYAAREVWRVSCCIRLSVSGERVSMRWLAFVSVFRIVGWPCPRMNRRSSWLGGRVEPRFGSV